MPKKKKFEVMLSFHQTSKASVVVEADTAEEAEEIAGDINADEIDTWNPVDGEVIVHDAEETDAKVTWTPEEGQL